jgi:hypothetical protein
MWKPEARLMAPDSPRTNLELLWTSAILRRSQELLATELEDPNLFSCALHRRPWGTDGSAPRTRGRRHHPDVICD